MSTIRHVWNNDIENVFDEINEITTNYPYIAVRATWAGFFVRPIVFEEYAYNDVKLTVDIMKCLQIAFAFADEFGNTPMSNSCFQFNFSFCEKTDIVYEATLDIVKQSGFDTVKAVSDGIEFSKFGEHLVNSGLLNNKKICWNTYCGAYDIGFLLRAITGKDLPNKYAKFIDLAKNYFCSVYDIRHMLFVKKPQLKLPQLSKAAETLMIKNIPFLIDTNFANRAGYHAIVCIVCFFKMLHIHFNPQEDHSVYNFKFFGLEIDLLNKELCRSVFS